MSLFCKLHIDTFARCLRETIDDYEKLWSKLGLIVTKHNVELPERKVDLPEQSSLCAWERAQHNFENVSLTGEMKFSDNKGDPIFQLSLKPLKAEKSFRLARKFGGDRFCIIGIPGIERQPPHLTSGVKQSEKMRARIVNLLTQTDVSFLGRKWRAFYLNAPKSDKKRRSPHQSTLNDIKFRVFFFAQDGDDFRKEGAKPAQKGGNDHSKIGVEEMLNWFMPFKENLKQPCLKFFARLALGSIWVSLTTDYF